MLTLGGQKRSSPMSSQSEPLPEQTHKEITQPKLSAHGYGIRAMV